MSWQKEPTSVQKTFGFNGHSEAMDTSLLPCESIKSRFYFSAVISWPSVKSKKTEGGKRKLLSRPFKCNFDRVSWFCFNHPLTIQGVFIIARPAWRKDDSTGGCKMSTTWSYKEENNKLLLSGWNSHHAQISEIKGNHKSRKEGWKEGTSLSSELESRWSINQTKSEII